MKSPKKTGNQDRAVETNGGTEVSPLKVQEDDRSTTSGLGIAGTAVLLVGEMVGTGVMALPYNMDHTGIIGVVVIFFIVVVCTITGDVLGQAWLLVQDRYDEYKGHVRHPYPTIAYLTFGSPGRMAFTVCTSITMVLGCEIMMLISTENIHSLLANIFDAEIPVCYVLVAVVFVLLPLSWLGTPKDFWVLGLLATGSSIAAVILILVAMAREATGPYSGTEVVHSRPQFFPFFQAVGSMCFMTSGHFAFPTIQNDMEQPRNFRWAVIVAFTLMACMYIPIAIVGYLIYGNAVAPNVLLSLTPGPLTYTVQLFVTLHTLSALIINVNPLLQHVEEMVGLSHGTSVKQIGLRTMVFIFLLIVGLLVPNFNVIMSLTGGSTSMLLSIVLPPVLYYKLCRTQGPWPTVSIPLHTKVLCLEIVSVGVLIGISSTVGNIISVTQGTALPLPCFLDVSRTNGG